jgi:hypothetical protein
LEELIKFDEEHEGQFQFMEEVVGLREVNLVESFPSKPPMADENQLLMERKTLGKMSVKIFKHLL